MTKKESKISSLEKTIFGIEQSILKYSSADEEEKSFFRDSAIQRFEIGFDLSWKVLKEYMLSKYGSVCASPKSCFRSAFENEVIENEVMFLEMTNDRNLMSHIYDEEESQKIFEKIPGYVKLLKLVVDCVKK